MQALTAQGASCQNYILVRGLLALPPCAFIEDDARGNHQCASRPLLGALRRKRSRLACRLGTRHRPPDFPNARLAQGSLCQTGLFACLASGYLRILMQLLLGIKIAEPRLLLLGVFVVINDLKMSNQI